MENPEYLDVDAIESPERGQIQIQTEARPAGSLPSDPGGTDRFGGQNTEADLPTNPHGEKEGRRATSTRQAEANRLNAIKSTGPGSVQGKRRSALNALKHGGYGGCAAIPRGILAESEQEIEEYVNSIVQSLGPRDAAELAVAKRIALSDLRLARLDRYEGVSLAKIGRVQPQFDEADDQSVETAVEYSIAASQLSWILAGEGDMELSLDVWQSCACVIWALHNAPPATRIGPRSFDDYDVAAHAWRRFVLEDLIPTYWGSAEAASSALKNEATRWTDFYLSVEGKAEERAVTNAISKDGPIDRLTTLRARIQREEDRDRATYGKLQERAFLDDEAFKDDTPVAHP